MDVKMLIPCYWRFIGEKAYRFGWPTPAPYGGLTRMGNYVGDTNGGCIVDPEDIEVKQ